MEKRLIYENNREKPRDKGEVDGFYMQKIIFKGFYLRLCGGGGGALPAHQFNNPPLLY
jgi:hypothetical protein